MMVRNYAKNWLSRICACEPARLKYQGLRKSRHAVLGIDVLEDRITPTPIPMVALGGAPDTSHFPTEVLIGEPAHLSVTFTNPGNATGYGPYIELFLPATGIDGRPGGCRDFATYP